MTPPAAEVIYQVHQHSLTAAANMHFFPSRNTNPSHVGAEHT